MNKCPFLAVHKITREIKYDVDGKVTEEKETPSAEIKECLQTECELFDNIAGKCSLPIIESQLQLSGGAVNEELMGVLKSILSETREARENAAASQLHVLKKAENANEILAGLREKMASGGTADLSPLQGALTDIKSSLDINQSKFSDILELMLEDQQKRSVSGTGIKEEISPALQGLSEIKDAVNSGFTGMSKGLSGEDLKEQFSPMMQQLTEIKESLNNSQTKFSDIMELMLDDQQKRSAESSVLKDTFSPVVQGLSDIKEALTLSQNKFGDILELMLEDQQRKASQSGREAELLSEISQKQDSLVDALTRGLNAEAFSQNLSEIFEKANSHLNSLGQSDASRQSKLEQIEGQLLKLHTTMQDVLDGQRNEQRDVSNERRRQKANDYNDRGVMLFHRRELAAAEAEFSKALDVRPDFAEAFNNLGLTLSDLGKREEAVESFKKAIDLAPDAPEAYNNLGCLYRVKKDYQQAVEFFNQAIAKREDYSLAYYNLGTAYEELEKFDLAIKAWEKVLTLQPTHEEARRKLASYRARRQ
jgi:tetratricopeptide (TPR) repeat protein